MGWWCSRFAGRRATLAATVEGSGANHIGIACTEQVMVQVRQPFLDILRGVAVLWMTAFHFAFDLNHFGFIHQDFYRDIVWTGQRTCILSLFLFCAGFGQAMAVEAGQDWRRFWKRWMQIALCAVAVSAGSALMFPNSWIYFGVLHGMAAMLIVCRLTRRRGGIGCGLPVRVPCCWHGLHRKYMPLCRWLLFWTPKC